MGVLTRTLGVQEQAPLANPWEAAIAKQLEELEALKARPPMYSPEQVMQRRDQNTREYELGLLGLLSGNEALGEAGGHVLKNALSMRQPKITERGSADQITGEFTYDPDYLRQQGLVRLDAYQKLAAAHDLKTDADRREREFKADMAQRDRENKVLIKTMGGGAPELGMGNAQVIGVDKEGNSVFRPLKGGPLFKYGPDGQPVAHVDSTLPKPSGATKTPAEVTRMMVGLGALDKAINRLEAELKDYDPRNLSHQVDIARRARIDSVYQQFITEAKEAAQLGALTGPDLGLVTGMLSNPTGPKGMGYGRKGIEQQIKETRNWVKSRRDETIQMYPHLLSAPAAPGAKPTATPASPDGDPLGMNSMFPRR